jgi:hypothetical protein
MMKKLLLTTFTACLGYAAMAQCVPDPNYVPSSPTGAGISDLESACINEPYNEAATIVIPPTVTYLTFQVTVCKVKLTSIDSIPNSLAPVNPVIRYNGNAYGLGQEISLTPGQTNKACVEVNGTFTELFNDSIYANGIASVSLTAGNCNTTTNLPLSLLGSSKGLPIAFVVEQCVLGIEETVSNNSFDVSQNYPNPFNGETQIAYNLTEAGKVTFRVTNLVGKTIKEVNMNGNYGLNYINISSTEFAAGVYMYSVSANGKTVTKRMIVR